MLGSRFLLRILALAGALLLAPRAAEANVGIPMLALFWPGMVLLLPFVILVEAATARRVFVTGWRSALELSSLANVVSTVAGIPLAWGALTLILMVLGPLASFLPDSLSVLFTPFYVVWLPPGAGEAQWPLPLAAAGLCVPMFFASVWIERWVGGRLRDQDHEEPLRRWSWEANLLSYGGIGVALVVVALVAALAH